MKEYTITLNHRKKTYTIRVYQSGKLVAKYRSYPQGKEFSTSWTQSDIVAFLKYYNDYYLLKP